MHIAPGRRVRRQHQVLCQCVRYDEDVSSPGAVGRLTESEEVLLVSDSAPVDLSEWWEDGDLALLHDWCMIDVDEILIGGTIDIETGVSIAYEEETGLQCEGAFNQSVPVLVHCLSRQGVYQWELKEDGLEYLVSFEGDLGSHYGSLERCATTPASRNATSTLRVWSRQSESRKIVAVQTFRRGTRRKQSQGMQIGIGAMTSLHLRFGKARRHHKSAMAERQRQNAPHTV